MLNKEDIMDIKLLSREGHSIGKIAHLTGRSRNTVRKVLRDGYSVSKKRKIRLTILDDYKVFIETKFKEGRPVPRILRDISEMGYAGSQNQVYRFLKPFRDEIRRKEKLTVRFETAPGEQAQVDWGHCGHIIDLDGRKKPLYVFAYILSYSRASYFELCTSMDLETLLSCHKNAFDYLGGVTEKILYDNMKTVKLSFAQLNPGMLDFASYYGFGIKTCRPYRPRTKGKVERSIHYFKNNFMPDRTFSSLGDANAQVLHWLEYEANARIHGTTKIKPCELLKKESLNDHRKIQPYQFINKITRKASNDGFLRYQGNRYSVPVKAAGKVLNLEHIGEKISIRLNDSIITEHEQVFGKSKTVAKKEHISEMWKLTLGNSTLVKNKNVIVFSKEVQVRMLSVYEEACQ
jgi:transposase